MRCHGKSTALDSAEEALRIDAEYPPALNVKFRALNRLGDRAAARAVATTALSLRADDIDVHLNYGLLLLENGETQLALRHFSIALALDPTSSGAVNAIKRAIRADR